MAMSNGSSPDPVLPAEPSPAAPRAELHASPEVARAPGEKPSRPDLLAAAGDRLSPVERWQIDFIRGSFEPGRVDTALRWCQRNVGAAWIHHCTKHVRHVYGLERLPALTPSDSVLCVCNHRSFFDLFVVTAELVRRGMKQRIAFPVRSQFFYDNPLGLFVNGVMSFFAMYPPIFRERRRLALNVTSLQELVWLLKRGGTFAGVHPEGTRKKDEDPYTFLPAQTGVGRVIYEARVPVVPVFINGLINDLPRQVLGNFDRSGKPVIVVFGKPVEFGSLIDQRPSPRVYRALAEHALSAIGELGAEEKLIRTTLDG
ncbi:MAG TPA: lysophospholipid acyltransferase family protein [Polyangiaceae bacterium]|nr:lysophospholipid acyltransferase family protein [Polyangiaceae bacterium]